MAAAISALVLLLLAPSLTDAFLTVWNGGYWIASLWVFFAADPPSKSASSRHFLVWLILIFGGVYFLDIAVSLSAGNPGVYRSLPPYLVALSMLLIGAVCLTWFALNSRNLFAASKIKPKYANSHLDDVTNEKLSRRFDSLMSDDRPFLNDRVTLSEVANMLDCQPRHVSQMVNSRFGQNFSSYINEKRLDVAATMLRSMEHKNWSVTKIMFEAGFGSKSTFNRAFRRKFEMSPREYGAR